MPVVEVDGVDVELAEVHLDCGRMELHRNLRRLSGLGFALGPHFAERAQHSLRLEGGTGAELSILATPVILRQRHLREPNTMI